MRKPRRPSLASVARAAGVSPTAVSLVLGGRGGDYRLSDGTSERIRQAAAAQGYVRPQRRRGPPRLHVVHLADLLGMEARGLGGAVLHPLMDALAGRGWQASVDPRLPVGPLDQTVLRASALVVPVNYGFDAEVARLAAAAAAAGVQPVVLGRCLADLDAIQVDGDQQSGGRLAGEHLLALGHRRIAVVGGHPDDPHTRARLDGFAAACAAQGVVPEAWGDGGFRSDLAHRLVAARLAAGARPSAIFCCNDRMAVGALLALREAGLPVPQRISLVGFDDQEEYATIPPGLTTVRFDAEGVGSRLAALLTPGARPQHHAILLPARLVIRSSSTAVAQGT